MADVTKIPGVNPQDQARGPREPAKPGTEKFKDLMKVDKSGDQQKKRKKRQEEAEEETKAQIRSGALAHDKEVTATKQADKTYKIQKVGESEKRQPQKQREAEEIVPAITAAETAAQVTQQNITALKMEREAASLSQKVDLSASFQQIIAEEKEIEKVEETIEKEEQKEDKQKPTPAQEALDQKETSSLAPSLLPQSSALGPLFIAPPAEAPPAYALLRAEILELFERMVGVISIMQESGIKETVIHLNTAEFSSSIFAGAQIVIKEFNTAPLAYNIEFIGSVQNTTLFEQNIGSLRAAFQSGHHRFRIHQITSSLARSEKPLFHRKSNVGDPDKNPSE